MNPYIWVAASFHDRIVPSRFFETMASSEFSTIAARYWASANSLRSVISRAMPAAPTIWPVVSLTGEIDSETSSSEPSLRRRNVS